MRFTRTTAIAALLLAGACLRAQNLTDLRVAEIVAVNEHGPVDGFGQRNGWIEIFNNSNGTVKFGGCYLTDDKDDLTKYHIPASDRSTQVGPRQSVVFHAGGDASHGTYYTNFTLANGETVYLVSNDGRTIIDELAIPADLPADWSVVKVPAGVKKTDFTVGVSEKPTPGAYNGDVDAKTNSQIMKEKDPHGWVLTLISVCVVFFALAILAFIFTAIGKAGGREKPAKAPVRKGGKGAPTPEVTAAIAMALSHEDGEEVCAAIAMALEEYMGGVHDEESFVITIKPTPGSAWAGKEQGFRKLPR